MESPQPMIYKVDCFDAEGAKIGNGPLVQTILPDDVEREVSFMETAVNAGAASYSVRLLRPRQVKQLLKAEAKAARPDFLTGLAKATGLFDIINLIAYLDQDRPVSQGAK